MTEKKNTTGLVDSQVLDSRARHGANILTPPPGVPAWRKFLEKFRDPLIIILLVAGALSMLIACYDYFGLGHGADSFIEPAGIFVAIILASGLAFYFENKADKEFGLLNQVNDDEPVQVIRNGFMTEVPKKDVVVGDIVVLNTGNDIPADGVLLEAVTLSVDESTLTGEPS
ncbi:MAG: haloacid dehalogenase, partial [Muribaculaceae bacterium]|nr:haloacid dehalogenase [Muribaculaceae bacterium]